MKAKFSTKDLSFGIGTIVELVGDGKIIQAYRNVLITAEESGRVELFGTDIEVLGSVVLNAEVTEGGEYAVPCKELHDWLSGKESAESVSVENIGEGKLKFKAGKSQLTLMAMSAAEYGARRGFGEYAEVLTVSGTEFKSKLKSTVVACADDTRAELSCVYVDFERGAIVGADGVRLALAGGYKMETKGMLIPRNSVKKISKVMGEGDVVLRRQESNGVIEYVVGEIKVTVGFVFLNGEYVAYWNITDSASESELMAKAPRAKWLSLMGSVKALQSDKAWPMRIESDGEDVTITNKDSMDSVGNVLEALDGGESFGKFRTYMNLGYTEEGVKVLKDGEIELRRFVLGRAKMWLFTDGDTKYMVAPFDEPDAF